MVAKIATRGVGGIFLLREEHGDAATFGGGDAVIIIVARTYPILVRGGVKGCGARDGSFYGSELGVGEQVAQGGAHVVVVGTVVIVVAIDVVSVGVGEVGVGVEIYVRQCCAHRLGKGIHFAGLKG